MNNIPQAIPVKKMSTYLEIKVKISSEFSEILMAELGSLNYDSFSESETGIEAYILESLFNESELKEVQSRYEALFTFEYEFSQLEDKNWNKEWEKNFTHTAVDDDVLIRASFHEPEKKYPYEIIINPQMSFGTGHHDTTAGVVRQMLHLDFKDKIVLDAGTGTGILAVMAQKLGAKNTYAYDIDEWSYNNCIDNFKLNDSQNIEIDRGDASLLNKFGKEFNIVLANINKNVLLNDIPVFADHIVENGYLVLSGFYENDIKDMEECCTRVGLTLQTTHVSDNSWTVLVLKKL